MGSPEQPANPKVSLEAMAASVAIWAFLENPGDTLRPRSDDEILALWNQTADPTDRVIENDPRNEEKKRLVLELVRLLSNVD